MFDLFKKIAICFTDLTLSERRELQRDLEDKVKSEIGNAVIKTVGMLAIGGTAAVTPVIVAGITAFAYAYNSEQLLLKQFNLD